MSKRRLQLLLDENAYKTLVGLESASNASSMAEVMRTAIGLLEWARQQKASGFTVGAFKNGEPAKEIILPF